MRLDAPAPLCFCTPLFLDVFSKHVPFNLGEACSRFNVTLATANYSSGRMQCHPVPRPLFGLPKRYHPLIHRRSGGCESFARSSQTRGPPVRTDSLSAPLHACSSLVRGRVPTALKPGALQARQVAGLACRWYAVRPRLPAGVVVNLIKL